ncbi:MAG TPA: methyl-accepting chemotaxis protein, partial [Candidatus Competibacter sp.]|nr:methyl-accepting chemotaxis protein [Candidatus Competibacter sp.]
QNAALVEQTAAASHSMGDQASELQRLMSFFKLDQRGTPTAVTVTPSSKATSKAQSPSQTVQKPDHRRPATVKPISIKSQLATRPIPVPQKLTASTATASDEWEEF